MDAALAYYRRGWNVIPTDGKKARYDWQQFQKESVQKGLIHDWFGRSAEEITGLGIILGSVSSGLAVRDFDDEQAYQRWAAAHPTLASSLPTVRTSRGYHVYFCTRKEVFKKFDDGELRGKSKQYVLAPPSLHPSGTIYEWIIPLPDGPLPLLNPKKGGLWPTVPGCKQSQRRMALSFR